MSDSDPALGRQPIGYWAGVTHRLVVGFVRAAIAGQGVSQPQWWLLNQLSTGPASRRQLAAALHNRLDSTGPEPAELDPLLDGLTSLGWATEAGGVLQLTDSGRQRRELVLAAVVTARRQVHDGIGEDEYVAALTVLRRMVRNVGGADGLI